DVICNDDAGTSDDGTITLTVVGGTAGYTYAWSNGATTQNLSGLAAGTYTVVVTDANGCTTTESFTIDQPEPLVATGVTTDVICNDDAGTSDDGTITLTVVGGTAGYTYAWSNGATTQNLSGLAAGTYTVVVTDANGCTTTESFTIDQPEPLVATGVTTDVTCNDDAGTSDDGTITLTVVGGTAGYTYAWSNGATTQNLSGLAAGT
ncbi:SprB repeat-containing protein, partial [Lewinella sp. W8]|uniref:SprB repeat-containing protein n=1 Tax=Lewinella sp. W8 TaxID=2528208 RepID=UPI00142B8EDE